MKNAPYKFPWKMAGLYILGAMVLLVLQFHFSNTIQIVLSAGLVMILLWFLTEAVRRQRRTSSQGDQLEANLENELFNHEKDTSRRKQTEPKPPSHTRFELCFHAIWLVLLAVYWLQKESVFRASQRSNDLLFVLILFTIVVFGTANLIWGIREKRIRHRIMDTILRSKSPANYWVAMAGWAWLTFGSLLVLTVKLKNLFHE